MGPLKAIINVRDSTRISTISIFIIKQGQVNAIRTARDSNKDARLKTINGFLFLWMTDNCYFSKLKTVQKEMFTNL